MSDPDPYTRTDMKFYHTRMADVEWVNDEDLDGILTIDPGNATMGFCYHDLKTKETKAWSYKRNDTIKNNEMPRFFDIVNQTGKVVDTYMDSLREKARDGKVQVITEYAPLTGVFGPGIALAIHEVHSRVMRHPLTARAMFVAPYLVQYLIGRRKVPQMQIYEWMEPIVELLDVQSDRHKAKVKGGPKLRYFTPHSADAAIFMGYRLRHELRKMGHKLREIENYEEFELLW